MIFISSNYICDVLFLVLGFPLAVHDIRSNSVPLSLLVLAYTVWLGMTDILIGAWSVRFAVAVITLLLGAVLLIFIPDKLGEADIVFMSGMAAIFPYWSFLVAIALGCISASILFLWRCLSSGGGIFSSPIPFLPSLYWGGIVVILEGVVF